MWQIYFPWKQICVVARGFKIKYHMHKQIILLERLSTWSDILKIIQLSLLFENILGFREMSSHNTTYRAGEN